MSDYIKREDAVKAFAESNVFPQTSTTATSYYAVADAILRKVPAADVREVNRAKWREGVYAGYRCSLCKTTWDAPTNFCPNCGAEMRGEDNGT